MTTDCALASISAHPSTDVSVCSSCTTSPSLAVGAAMFHPPKRTLTKLRFIATHMIYDRIAPLEPTKAPTIVRRSLFMINPSAQSAQPLYELSTVITTGISAPPIEAVVCAPSAPATIAQDNSEGTMATPVM